MQAGELRGQSLSGPIEIESNDTRITLEDLAKTRRPIRINATGGSVTLAGVESETRIDGRDTSIDVTIAKPAPIAIYNEADESMEVTLPERGVQLDALATDGRLTVPEGLLEVKTTGRASSAPPAQSTAAARRLPCARRAATLLSRKRRTIASHFSPLPTSHFPLQSFHTSDCRL